jgi:catabolite regulation protein CreA
VRRLYDPDRRNLLYVAYSTRLSTAADEGTVTTGRYRTSICAVHLPDAPPVAQPAALPSVEVGAEE